VLLHELAEVHVEVNDPVPEQGKKLHRSIV
jgi:hypothetical protein